MEKTILDLNFIESHLENFCGDKLSSVAQSNIAPIDAVPYEKWKEFIEKYRGRGKNLLNVYPTLVFFYQNGKSITFKS